MLKRKNKSWLIIIGSLFFLVGIIILSHNYFLNKKIERREEIAIKSFYENDNVIELENETDKSKQIINEKDEIKYIALIKIPKIKLERGLVEPDSYLNNVNYNLEWVDSSDMPDKENGVVIIAGHSGNSRISYFRKLDKLSINDDIIIIYKEKQYNYKIVNIYDIEKAGTAEIITNKDKTSLVLITCRNNTSKQIVVVAELN